MQVETIHTQQESIYQQNPSTERQTSFFIDSDREIELADTELALICGGQDGGDNPCPPTEVWLPRVK